MADNDKISLVQALQEQASGRPVDWTAVEGFDEAGAPLEDTDAVTYNPFAPNTFGGPIDAPTTLRATEQDSNDALAAASAANEKDDDDVADADDDAVNPDAPTEGQAAVTEDDAEAVREATPGSSSELPLLANNEAAGEPNLEATRVATGAVDAEVASDGTGAPVDAEDAAEADEKAAAAGENTATPDEAAADAKKAKDSK